jgi:hypothetical protein
VWTDALAGVQLPAMLVIRKDATGHGALVGGKAAPLSVDEPALIATIKQLRGQP